MDAPDLDGARKRLLQGGFEVVSLVEEGQPLGEEELAVARRPPSKLLIYVGLALFALGGMVGLASWLRRPIGKVAPPQPLTLVFQGQARGACQRVMLDLPELPYHQEAILKAGRYRLEVQLKVQQKPTYAWVQAIGAVPTKALPLDAESRELPSRTKVELKPGRTDYPVDELNY